MKYKSIIEMLKKDHSARVTWGTSKWLYFDIATNEWVVMEQGYRKKKPSEIFRGTSQSLAANILCE